MSEPALVEEKGHDPHFLAHASAVFEARLVEESTPHWFALTPLLMPHRDLNGQTGSRLVIMVAIWRKSGLGNATITSCEPVADYWNLTEDAVVDHHCTQVVRKLDQAYHGQLVAPK